MALPKGFVDLTTAYNASHGTFVNIIGAVVDIRPPVPTRTNDYMMTFKLLDQSLRDAVYGTEGLTIRFFRADPKLLPQIGNIGDIVLLRSLKAQPFNGQPMAISHFTSGSLVFPTAAIPAPSYSIAFQGTNRMRCLGVPADVEKLSLEEQAYIVQLKASLSAVTVEKVSLVMTEQSKKREAPVVAQAGPPAKKAKLSVKSAQSSTFGPKFKLVEDLRHYQFADICGQVVKKFPNHFGSCELYITDYTENTEMFFYTPPEEEREHQREGDDFGYNQPSKRDWPGPWGQLVLKVNLKDPHASFANNNIAEDDMVLLKNVKIKVRNENCKLEGDIWPDDRNPDKVLVSKLKGDVPEITELRARKATYWAARKSKEPQAQEGTSKANKNAKKKQKRLLKEAEALAQSKIEEEKRGDATNDPIRCSNEVTELTTIRDILDPDNFRHTARYKGMDYTLPFVNAKYRVKARVVDFLPKSLEDFAVELLAEDELEKSSMDVGDFEATPKVEWSFDLLLEDATGGAQSKAVGMQRERMWVTLGHEEAQYLLGSLPDPQADLGDNKQLLAQLRERLYLLWGNLEEEKEEKAVSNKPFECCIWEYAVKMDEDDPERKTELGPLGKWKKMFRMAGATIME